MIMRLIRRRLVPLSIALAVLCGLQIGMNSAATAAPAPPTQAAATHAVIPADVTCPASGYACLYQNANFLSDQAATSITESFSGLVIDNTMSSVRNRTNCTLRFYDTYNYTGSYYTVGPNTEVSYVGATWNDRASSIKFFC